MMRMVERLNILLATLFLEPLYDGNHSSNRPRDSNHKIVESDGCIVEESADLGRLDLPPKRLDLFLKRLSLDFGLENRKLVFKLSNCFHSYLPSTFGIAVFQIVRICSKKQMIRIDTGRIVTLVKN